MGCILFTGMKKGMLIAWHRFGSLKSLQGARTATCLSSAAAPRDRRSRRCSPSAAAASSCVEKDQHPRFHIGKSLLPLNLPLFERLGVKRGDRADRRCRNTASSSSRPITARASSYDFAKALGQALPLFLSGAALEFDHILLKNAAAKGAEVIEAAASPAIDFPRGGRRDRAARDERARRGAGRAAFSSTPRAATRCSPASWASSNATRKQQQRRHLRPFHRRAPPARARPRAISRIVLVRSWLVLVHSAGRWHDQRRRGLPGRHSSRIAAARSCTASS